MAHSHRQRAPCAFLFLLLSALLLLTAAAPGLLRVTAAEAEAAAAEDSSDASNVRLEVSRDDTFPSEAAYVSRSQGGASSGGFAAESLFFDSLSESGVEEVLQSPSGSLSPTLSLGEQVRSFASGLSASELVHVVLVGFNGDGDAGVQVSTGELGRYLAHAGLGEEQAMWTVKEMEREVEANKEKEKEGKGKESSPHLLPFPTRFVWRVSHASPALRDELQSSLQSSVDALLESNPHLVRAVRTGRAGKDGQRPALPTVPIPSGIVTAVLERETRRIHAGTTSIYLLNLRPLYLGDDERVEKRGSTPSGSSEGAEEQSFDEDPALLARRESNRLRYVYTQDWRSTHPSNASVVASDVHACPTNHWPSPSQRLVWMDLGAGPLSYGPASWGEGIVTEYSLPSPARMLRAQQKEERRKWALTHTPQDERPFVPSRTLDPSARHSLLAGLGALLGKMSSALLQPTVDHWPVRYAPRIKLHLVFVHERHVQRSSVPTRDQAAKASSAASPAQSLRSRKTSAQQQSEEHIASSSHSNTGLDSDAHQSRPVDEEVWDQFRDDDDEHQQEAHSALPSFSPLTAWREVESALLSLGLAGQEVEVHAHHLRLESCGACVAALTHALRTHTSNVAMGADGGAPRPGAHTHLRTHVSRYVDSAELKDWLEHFDGTQWGMKPPEEERGRTRVIRAFVYDLAARDLILLDRYHQSIPFPRDDLVLSIQTRSVPAAVDYTCEGVGMNIDVRDASRATLASLLTVGWGITPPTELWNDAKHAVEQDFLFSQGLNPFGVFSNQRGLNFAIKHSALRNMVLSELHESLDQLSSLFSTSGPPDALLDELLDSAPDLHIAARLGVVRHRLDRARHWLGLARIGPAWSFVRAVRHDVNQLATLVRDEQSKLHISLECGGGSSSHDGRGADSFLGALASSHMLLFLVLELALLSSTIGCVWLLTSNPALVVRMLPSRIVHALGLSRFSKHKNF